MTGQNKRQCSTCKEEVEGNSHSCKYCGALIAKTSHEYVERCSDVKDYNDHNESKKICSRCGEVNKATASVCYSCNYQLKNSEILNKDKDYVGDMMKKENQREKRSKILNIFFVVSTVIFLFVLYILSMIKMNSYAGGASGDISVTFLTIAVIMIISIINIFCPELLFYLRYEMWVKDAEPTDLYIMIGKLAGYGMSLLCIIYACVFYFSMA